MKTLPGPLFLFLWLQLDCVSRGEKVEQRPSFLSVQEGDSAVIHCTYTDSASTSFFWYKQQPGAGLQLLMQIFSSMEKKQDQRLTVLLRADGQKVEQNPQVSSILEGENASLTCNYTNYSPESFQWYRQDPGGGLFFLLLVRENEGEKQKGRLRVTFDTTIKQSALHIIVSRPADSATYLCALTHNSILAAASCTQTLPVNRADDCAVPKDLPQVLQNKGGLISKEQNVWEGLWVAQEQGGILHPVSELLMPTE
ncbi:T-cell receptor alpha chain V region CTL-L17 [Sciurus carolinensis]|nr:T-cell receptor alpha chain V region CTL-L17 [Sciurus carolinensis]